MADDAFELLVPGSALEYAVWLAGRDKPDSILVRYTETHVWLLFNEHAVIARLTVGKFPNYVDLLPSAWEARVTLARTSAVKAVERAVKFAGDFNPLRLRISEDGVEISVHEQGRAVIETVVGANLDGRVPDAQFGVNPRFFLDGLQALSDPEVTLRVISPLRPVLLGGSKDAGYLLMPIRLSG